MGFEDLVSKTLAKVEVLDSDRIVFTTNDGTAYASYHLQDCCESVTVYDVTGNEADLIGAPIIEADETFSNENPPPDADCWTWTFQRIKTEKGEVTFTWLGESNGYYGETPYFGLTHDWNFA